jgi:hypothetical protein
MTPASEQVQTQTQAESQDPARDAEPARTYVVADLVCFLCGATAGTVAAEQRPPPVAYTYTPAGGAAVDVADWRRLRCPRCGGALFPDDVRIRRERPEPVAPWAEERPRRGRPPKWLVEQRRREAEALERRVA